LTHLSGFDKALTQDSTPWPDGWQVTSVLPGPLSLLFGSSRKSLIPVEQSADAGEPDYEGRKKVIDVSHHPENLHRAARGDALSSVLDDIVLRPESR
jgi:hypothetical protein